MQVRLIKRITIQDFVLKNPDSRAGFREWISKLNYADWVQPSDIRNTFTAVEFLGKGTDRVVFGLCGTRYRVIGKYVFCRNCVYLYIKWCGPQPEYEKLRASGRHYIVDE